MLHYKQCIPFHKKSHQTLKPKNVRSHCFLPCSALFIFPPFYVHRLMRTVFPGSSDTLWAFGRSIYRNELVKLPSSRNSSGDWETGVQPCWCFPHLLFFHQKKLDGGLEFFHQKAEHCQRWHNLVSIQAPGTLSRHRSFDCPTNAIARTLAVCCGKKCHSHANLEVRGVVCDVDEIELVFVLACTASSDFCTAPVSVPVLQGWGVLKIGVPGTVLGFIWNKT